MLAAGAIPVTKLAATPSRCACSRRPARRFGAATRASLGALRLNGRGLAAADVGNDGRMDVAINTIGGKLVLLRSHRPRGHWLDVALSRFAPGAVVTVSCPTARASCARCRPGSSYLSSEDPRVHFGLGTATRVDARALPVGRDERHDSVPPTAIVDVAVPPLRTPLAQAPRAACTPAQHAGSIATVWDETAVSVLRAGGASEPVQARDLYRPRDRDVGRQAHVAGRDQLRRVPAAAVARVVQREPRDDVRDPDRRQLRCAVPLGRTRPREPIAAAAIAAGRRDGSNESMHYADPTLRLAERAARS